MTSVSAVRRNKSDGNQKPKVWSARVCPYAERVLFVLNELQIEYEPVFIDLRDKPPRLLELNPEGKVPVIEDVGKVFVESLICMEYLDEAFESPTGKKLLPGTAADRAQYKIAAEYINSKFAPQFYAVLKSPNGQETDKAIQKLLTTIQEIDKKMRKFSEEGPYFTGKELTFVDIALMPHVRRLVGLKHIKGFEIPDDPKFKRFLKWQETCMNTPSYKKLVDNVSNEEIIDAHKLFVAKK